MLNSRNLSKLEPTDLLMNEIGAVGERGVGSDCRVYLPSHWEVGVTVR